MNQFEYDKEKLKAIQEIKILSKFIHPFIVQILDFEITETNIKIVMPLYKKNLKLFIEKNRIFLVDMIKYLLYWTLDALYYGNKVYKIDHHNIKLENILLDE